MPIKKYKPVTPGLRFKTSLSLKELTQTEPEKSLLVAVKKSGGRMNLAAAVVVSYLLGSLVPGLWIPRLKGVDIRKHGSGNPGATNVYRVLGMKYALAVGIVARLVPQINAMMMAFPLRIAIGLVMLGAALPFMARAAEHDFVAMARQLLGLLKAT